MSLWSFTSCPQPIPKLHRASLTSPVVPTKFDSTKQKEGATMNYIEVKLRQLDAVGAYRVYGQLVDFDHNTGEEGMEDINDLPKLNRPHGMKRAVITFQPFLHLRHPPKRSLSLPTFTTLSQVSQLNLKKYPSCDGVSPKLSR